MEVCGGQTHALLRHGIDAQLEGIVRLIHGPGCPVCVTPVEFIDFAVDLAKRPGVLLASFGDVLRVPGGRQSLLEARAERGQVRIIYSPLDAVELARRNADREVVLFAVGFETTAPASALAVQQANRLGLTNFSVLASHVRVQPAMEMIVSRDDNSVQGFLAAGHVCTVVGCDSYEEFVRAHRLPVVVTGFEPFDLLCGIIECVRQLESGEARVCNCYKRSVSAKGNQRAVQVMADVYEVCDRRWRGLGVVAGGGLRLREQWARFDAEKRFPRLSASPPVAACECRSGEVLAGRLKPTACEWFGGRCTPDSPLGAPMVSAEGACAAYYRYAASPGAASARERH
jgi:hydrogenase expression/formation protein HypD